MSSFPVVELDKIQSALQSAQEQPGISQLIRVWCQWAVSRCGATEQQRHTLKQRAVPAAKSVRKSQYSRETVLIKVLLLHQLQYLVKQCMYLLLCTNY